MEGYKAAGKEKVSYAMYFFGQNLFFALIGLNIHVMFSDAGITAATVAIVLMVARMWDAVNDPLFGILIDKVRFKGGGRFLPWLRLSLPLISVTALFMFFMPLGFSLGAKIIWAAAGYVLWSMSYTLCDVPIFLLPTSMTDNIKERTGILARGRYFSTVATMITMASLPFLQERIGWLVTGMMFVAVATLTMLPALFTIKERNILRPEKTTKLKDMMKFVAGNKYLLIFYIGMFFSNITNFTMSLMLLFPRYNLGDQELGTLVSAVGAVPILFVGIFIPALTKRIDKFTLFFFANIAAVVMNVLRYFIGYGNLTVFLIALGIQGFAMGATSILLYMFTPDCLEYGTYHTGERSEGVAASVQTFFVKLTTGLSGPLAMLIIGFFGFIEGDVATQPDSALRGLWLCMTIFPAVGLTIATLIWSRFKLRDKYVQIMAAYNNGKISKEEAEAHLGDKFGAPATLIKMVGQ